MGAQRVRDALQGYGTQRLERIFDWQRQINLGVLPLNAGEETQPQLFHLLAQDAPQRRVR